jgi:hypothetical protein
MSSGGKRNSFGERGYEKATEWSRTINPRFTKAVLCQLSYGGASGFSAQNKLA